MCHRVSCGWLRLKLGALRLWKKDVCNSSMFVLDRFWTGGCLCLFPRALLCSLEGTHELEWVFFFDLRPWYLVFRLPSLFSTWQIFGARLDDS